MSISLSSGVRQSLQSLQSTAALAQTSQQRLATGLKVNSAIDNPSSYFTAQGLNNRADQLSSLLDGMSNSIQTIQAASTGIDGITKLVKSLQSTVKQAQSDAAQNRPSVTGDTALATSTEAAAAGKSIQETALNKTVEGDLGVTAGSTVLIKAGNTTYTFDTDSDMTVRDLVNNINKSGIATAAVNSNGKFSITGTGSDALNFDVTSDPTDSTKAGDGLDELKFATADVTKLKTGGAGATVSANSSVRANLISQFNDLRTQIDDMAKDSGYNGLNLLAGDKLSIVMNEKTGSSQSKIDIQGQTITADNLGIGEAVNGSGSGSQVNFQNDSSLNTLSDTLTSTLSTLQSLSSALGSKLSAVQTRQDFSNSMISTLKTGASNLTNADTNEEGANLLALQTRQSLAQTALSLSAQADQAVLKLF